MNYQALAIVFVASAVIAALVISGTGRRDLDERLGELLGRRQRRAGGGAGGRAAAGGAPTDGGVDGPGATSDSSGAAAGRAAGRAAGAGGDRPRRGLFSALDRRLEARRATSGLALKLRRADLRLRVGEFLTLVLVAGMAGGVLGAVWLGALGGLGLSCAGAAAPFIYVNRRCEARLRAFGAQLPDALLIMANCLRSGYSILQAMDVVGRELPPPIGRDFDQVVREVRVNIPIEDALRNLVGRVSSPDLDLVVTAILIQRQVGGNLAEVLDRITSTIRERVRIQGEIRTLTAQGRISGWIIACLPAALGFLLYLMSPAYIRPLIATPAGWAMLGLAVCMQMMGMFFISRLTRIEV